MIPAVIVSLVLVASTIALPLSTQENPITGTIETPQIHSGIPLTILPQQLEKTKDQTSEYYTTSKQANTQTGQSDHYTSLNTPVEKTGYQTSSEVQTNQQYTSFKQQNTAVPKVENVPVNVEETQSVYSQKPVLLPVQPLSVVPFNPSGQVLRPIVVPAEAIADGRVVITPIGSVQQRNFQEDVVFVPENIVPYQQVSHPTTFTAAQNQGVEPNQQTYYVQPVEKQGSVQQEIQPTSQLYTPVYPKEESFNREQQAHGANIVKQTAESFQNYNQAQQNVLSVVTENTEKQVAISQVPVQVESNPQQVQLFNVQGTTEKQVSYQQLPEYQTQGVELGQQQQVYNPQDVVEKQSQQVTVQNVQAQNTAEKTEKQGQYQESQKTVEKQVPYQQPIQSVQPAPQQQVYSVHTEQVESQFTNYPTTEQENVGNVSEQKLKTSEVKPNQQVVNVRPQPVVSYAGEPVYSFGEKLPQVQHNVPVHILSSEPQESHVQPSLSITQE